MTGEAPGTGQTARRKEDGGSHWAISGRRAGQKQQIR